MPDIYAAAEADGSRIERTRRVAGCGHNADFPLQSPFPPSPHRVDAVSPSPPHGTLHRQIGSPRRWYYRLEAAYCIGIRIKRGCGPADPQAARLLLPAPYASIKVSGVSQTQHLVPLTMAYRLCAASQPSRQARNTLGQGRTPTAWPLPAASSSIIIGLPIICSSPPPAIYFRCLRPHIQA